MICVSEIHIPVLIIISEKDEAGMNILPFILEMNTFEKRSYKPPQGFPVGKYDHWSSKDCAILVIPGHQIYCDYLIPYINAKLLIFASKHFSSAGQKALLVHTTGIWDKATEHGGKDNELSIAPSYALYKGYHLIKSLQSKYKLDHYWVGIEVTHHGPTSFEIPIIFVETGGTSEEWNDLDACKLISEVVILLAKLYTGENISKMEDLSTMIGIGGGHYAPAFIRRLDEEKYYLGHIMPKFVLEKVDKKMIKQAWEKTQAEKKIFLIDKKGTRSSDRNRIINYIEELDYNWEYSKS